MKKNRTFVLSNTILPGLNVSASNCGFFIGRTLYKKEASTYPAREQHTPVSCV